MKHARMLYKLGTKIKTKLGIFDYIVVDQCDEKKFTIALNDGYYMTQAEAVARKHDSPPDPKPVETGAPNELSNPPETEEPKLSKREQKLKEAQEKLKNVMD